jgi:hypothetical protein
MGRNESFTVVFWYGIICVRQEVVIFCRVSGRLAMYPSQNWRKLYRKPRDLTVKTTGLFPVSRCSQENQSMNLWNEIIICFGMGLN